MGVKERMASTEMQQKISQRIFMGSNLKDKEGNLVDSPELGKTYLLYSKETDKKIGWIKTPKEPGDAGYGWCNLPAYLKLPKVPEEQMPLEVQGERFEEVPMNEYQISDLHIEDYADTVEAPERVRDGFDDVDYNETFDSDDFGDYEG